MEPILGAVDIIVWCDGVGIDLKQSPENLLVTTIKRLIDCPGDNDLLIDELLTIYGDMCSREIK